MNYNPAGDVKPGTSKHDYQFCYSGQTMHYGDTDTYKRSEHSAQETEKRRYNRGMPCYAGWPKEMKLISWNSQGLGNP
jgi:hypothetical protein